MKYKLHEKAQENKHPNIRVEATPKALLKYDLVCFMDEDWLEVMLKSDDSLVGASQIDRLLSSTSFLELKKEFGR